MITPPEAERPSPEALARVRELTNRKLSSEEFEAIVRAPMSDAEREGIWALIDWFTRRYPTPLERLAYVKRAYERWRQAMP